MAYHQLADGKEYISLLVGKLEDGEVYVDDVLLPKQEVSHASCSWEAKDLTQFEPEVLAKVIGWCHSHGNMNSFLSSTDMNQIETMGEIIPLVVSLVISNGNGLKGWVDLFEPIRVQVEGEISVVPPEDFLDECEKEFKDKVSEKKYTYSRVNRYPYYYYDFDEDEKVEKKETKKKKTKSKNKKDTKLDLHHKFTNLDCVNLYTTPSGLDCALMYFGCPRDCPNYEPRKLLDNSELPSHKCSSCEFYDSWFNGEGYCLLLERTTTDDSICVFWKSAIEEDDCSVLYLKCKYFKKVGKCEKGRFTCPVDCPDFEEEEIEEEEVDVIS